MPREVALSTKVALARAADPREWRRFVHEYMQDYNGSAAYARAFNAHHMSGQRRAAESNRLLAHPEVAAQIERLSEARLTLANVNLERVTLELARVAFSDIGDAVTSQTIKGVDGSEIDVEVPLEIRRMKEDVRRAVREVTFTKQGATIKMVDKQAALETLAKMLLVQNGYGPTGVPRPHTKALQDVAKDHDAVSDDEIALMLAEADEDAREADEDAREPDQVLDADDE